MNSNTFVGCLLLLFSVKHIEGQNHVIIYPKLFRVDVFETVIVTLHGYGSVGTRIVAWVKDGHVIIGGPYKPAGSTSADRQVKLNVKAPGAVFHEDNLRRKNLILHVQITFPNREYQVINDAKEIGVIGNQDQIFVLTDRPIYRPTDSVSIRVAALDHNLLPLSDAKVEVSITLQLGGERTSIWKKTIDSGGSFANAMYRVPEGAPLTSYVVVAKLVNKLRTSEGTAEFKVARYVLPTFNVKITLDSNIVQPDGEISGEFVARYTYGENVTGKYGIEAKINVPGGKAMTFYKKPKDPGRHIPGLMEGSRAGWGNFNINIREAQAKANLTWEQLIKAKATIKIIVSVKDNAGGVTESGTAEGILITESLNKIDLSETSKYFVPSLPHHIDVIIRDVVTGKPVEVMQDVSVSFLSPGGRDSQHGVTDMKGRARIAISTNISDRSLQLNITSGNSHAAIDLVARNTDHGYLMITAPSYGLVGRSVKVGFEAKCTGIVDIYYLVLCRGNVKSEGKIPARGYGACFATTWISIRSDASPKVRLVAYYMNGNHIISDSVSISTDETCIGKELTISITDLLDHVISKSQPGKRVKLKLSGEANANVSLGAVNRAAYFLNSKGLINRAQMFKKMNNMDMGCSFGGGSSTENTFEDAGLALASKYISTKRMRSLNCSEDGGSTRRKRGVGASDTAMDFDKESVRMRCFANGRVENLAGLDCSERLSIVEQSNIEFLDDCLEEFQRGCAEGEKVRRRIKFRKKFARSGTATFDKDSDTPAGDKRTRFDDLWLWMDLDLDNYGVFQIRQTPPDSITTYDLTAVSLHNTSGICISKPAELTVFKDVFFQFYLPYSVKLNEEVQIRAAIFNYKSREIRVNVLIKTDKFLCTRASQGRWSGQGTFTIASRSSTSFVFMAVPIIEPENGENPIIKARIVENEIILDEIEQPFRIESTGELKEFSGSFTLDPNGGGTPPTIEFEFPNENIIETTKQCRISGFMTNLGPLIEFNPIDEAPANLGSSITLPYGCGEQNMMTVGPNVFIFLYLQSNNNFSHAARDKVESYIIDGYARQQKHRNKERWSVWSSSEPTIWINAYVNRVFLHSQDVWPEIDLRPICTSWNWVLQKQNPETGVFSEDRHARHHVNLKYGGDLALTALVLISMAERESNCSSTLVDKMNTSKTKAADYLRGNYSKSPNAYTAAIVAYALSTLNTVGATIKANKRLFSMKTEEDDKIYWTSRTTTDQRVQSAWHRKYEPIDVETTAYALLAQVKIARSSGNRVDADTREFINKIARWMVGQENDRGGFKTSFTTVVAIQSLVEYTKWMNEINPPPRDPHLSMNINLMETENKWSTRKFDLDRSNEFHRKVLDITNEEIKGTKNIKVEEISGDGVGLLSYRCTYRTTVDNGPCDYNITVKTEMVGKDLTIVLSIWKKSQGKSAMANIEVSLLSGFKPHEDSFNLISKDNGVADGVIDYHEVSDTKIVLYVNGIPDSSQNATRFGFKLTKAAEIANVNPAQIRVYDYYNPEKSQCSIFYTLPGERPSMIRNCKENGARCKCLETTCVSYRNITQQVNNTVMESQGQCGRGCQVLRQIVCSRNYAYKIQILEIDNKSMPLFTKLKARVFGKIYQRDVADINISKDTTERIFILKTDCFDKYFDKYEHHSIKENGTYLVAGHEAIEKSTLNGIKRFEYWLSKEDVIEKTVSRAAWKKAKVKEPQVCGVSHHYNAERCEKMRNRIKIFELHKKLKTEIVNNGCD